MSKQITTRQTIQNLIPELKKTFAKKTELTPIQNLAASAFHSGKVDGNSVHFYTSADQSGSPAFTIDLPAEFFLDQAKTAFVGSFAWSEETYPGSSDPGMDGKPVMVLAVKGDDGSVTYSFLNMATLVDTYKAKTEGKDASTTVTVEGYEIDVKVNISADEGNALEARADGLFVPPTDTSGKADKVEGATEGNLAALDAAGNLTDSGKKAGDFVEKVLTAEGAEDAVLHESDIADYSTEEIAALLADEATE